MKLSIIIVNYNVRFFLEQCLASVFAAGEGLEIEVWVVDNNSVDDSVAMVKERYPQVHIIANRDNPGFAKANNQALRQATGDYMLLLNPDTVVERDTFRICTDFMQQHPDCGGLGVKMINGEGKYLKESKRGFPTPRTSFFKISGLIRVFPHHPKIAAYYMGHIDEDTISEIEILSGAFLMISREALAKVGLLDESYFMYGEDIDFSWRIRLAGYKNYYLPTTRIIHYKGESTKKGSLNYVYTFYNAMIIFSRRYFSGNGAKFYLTLIQLAIWLRATLSFIERMLRHIALPAIDFAVAFAGFVAIKQIWASYWAENINYYPPVYTYAVLPLYILIMMLCSWLNGGYDKPLRYGRIVRGIAIGCGVLLVFYSLLNESLRYSRAVLLLGSVWTLVSAIGLRGLLALCKVDGYRMQTNHHHASIIVGSKEEYARISKIYDQIGIESDEVVHADIADVARLQELIRVYRADEVIFSSQDLPPQEIISLMLTLKSSGVEYKIAPEDANYIIGSNSISSCEDLYTIELNTIASQMNQRNKRLFDIFSSLLLLLLSPVLLWFQSNKRSYLCSCCAVLMGRKSWVNVSNGVFSPKDILPGHHLDPERMNLRYTRNYKVATDATILIRNLFTIQ